MKALNKSAFAHPIPPHVVSADVDNVAFGCHASLPAGADHSIEHRGASSSVAIDLDSRNFPAVVCLISPAVVGKRRYGGQQQDGS